LGSLLLAAVIGAGVLAFNAGAAQSNVLGMAVAPVVAGLLAVLLLLFVLRLAMPLLMIPLFGFGFMRWRRHGFGHGWKHRAWRHHGKWSNWEEGVPPMVSEWHRRMHEMESEPQDSGEASV
jgi:hypothetical protein